MAVAFRAGVLNIGAEGQFLAGATAAAAVGMCATAWSHTAQALIAVPLALVAGSASGMIWAGVAAWLRRQFGVLEVISTIMLNFIALEGVGYLVRGPLQEPLHIYPQTPSLPDAMHLPFVIPGTRVHAGFLLALALAVLMWWIMRATAIGFRWRASGANPLAAAIAGRIDVNTTTMQAFLVSGALAGVAGAVEVTGVTYALYENISPGYGYTAIAVALLANLDPLGVVVTGLVFGVLESGAAALQRDAGVPAVLASVIEAAIILVVLMVPRLRAKRA